MENHKMPLKPGKSTGAGQGKAINSPKGFIAHNTSNSDSKGVRPKVSGKK